MASLQVSDCMSTRFITLSPTLQVFEAAKELLKNEVLGAPVVDEGKLVGWVSEQDCLKMVLQVVYFENRVARVEDIMSPSVLTTRPNSNAIDLCNEMLHQKPKNYPVVDDDGNIIGIVSRRMILRALLN